MERVEGQNGAAYFDRFVINRVDPVDTQADADQDKHSPSTPRRSRVPAWRTDMNIGSRIYIGLVYHTVCGHSNPETCFGEGMYKSSVTVSELLLDKLTRRVLT